MVKAGSIAGILIAYLVVFWILGPLIVFPSTSAQPEPKASKFLSVIIPKSAPVTPSPPATLPRIPSDGAGGITTPIASPIFTQEKAAFDLPVPKLPRPRLSSETRVKPDAASGQGTSEGDGSGSAPGAGQGNGPAITGEQAVQLVANLRKPKIGIIIDASVSMIDDPDGSRPNSPRGLAAITIVNSLPGNTRLQLSSNSIVVEDVEERPADNCICNTEKLAELTNRFPGTYAHQNLIEAINWIQNYDHPEAKDHPPFGTSYSDPVDILIVLTDLEDRETPEGIKRLKAQLGSTKLIIFSFEKPGSPELIKVVHDSGGEIYQVDISKPENPTPKILSEVKQPF